MPQDFAVFVETLDAEFPGRLLRLFRGPMWSGCATNDVGLISKVSSKYIL
jgi:hypothetical protein